MFCLVPKRSETHSSKLLLNCQSVQLSLWFSSIYFSCASSLSFSIPFALHLYMGCASEKSCLKHVQNSHLTEANHLTATDINVTNDATLNLHNHLRKLAQEKENKKNILRHTWQKIYSLHKSTQ